jgi:DNA polymerase-3 subunit beta
MKVVVLPENILSFLPLINKVLPLHSQIPILSNVLLDANDSGFFIRSTDLEMGAEVKIPAKIEDMGAVTVPGREFVEAINSLPKDKATIMLEKDILTVSCRGNKVSFNTIPQDEFPKLFKEKGEEVARFTKKEFLDIFSRLIFSVSQEETRPQLAGIYIDSKDDKTNFVSTDGYRMSIRTLKTPQKKMKESLIVAVGLINEVISLKEEHEIILYVNKGENQVVFEVGDAIVVGRMIEEKFPDYEGVLPTQSKTVVLFDREELLQNVRLVAVFAKDNSNIASLEIQGNEIKLSTRTQGVGEGETTVECQKKGEDNKISFNIKYLLDVLKNVSDRELELHLNSSTEPAVFKTKEKDFLHVIMPIQVE